ncbi:MAG: proton-conducting membrane transporter [Clostridia bacterium]|nr:proton-conducting membrane transporter [Clostridia bacterium]
MILFTIILTAVLGLMSGFFSFKKRNTLCAFVIVSEAIVSALCIMAAIGEEAAETYGKGFFALSFECDTLSRIMCLLIGFGWLLCAVFSSVYMKHETREGSFYCFMLLAEAFSLGVVFAADLTTLYLMFEATTLLSMPLVLHNRKNDSVNAAKTYLFYSLGGAFTALLGMALIYTDINDFSFAAGGAADVALSPFALLGVFLCVTGFGAKAGMFPLHAWLPTAHPVAPAPASALLSGLITKSGVVAIIRVIYYVAGTKQLTGTWVQNTLLVLSLLTVLMGSVLALRENELKKRLAYSSVSQISYVLTGLFVMCDTAYDGALIQIIFHASAKIGLFLCAGALIYLTGKKNTEDYVGLGNRYPVIMWCFTLLSLSLIGIPPFGGFFSKWNIAVGALSALDGWMAYAVPTVLLISALYTAGYLLPVSVKAFFPGKNFELKASKNDKEPLAFTLPLLILSAFVLVGGVLCNMI